MQRIALLLAALLLFVPATAAEDEPKSPVSKPLTSEQAVDAVLNATRDRDDVALKALAEKDDPDPWIVVDALCDGGTYDAADRFAKAAPRPRVKQLPDYVAARREKPTDKARRELLAKVNAALATGDDEQVLTLLGAMGAGPIEDVVGARLAFGRGLALESLARLDDACDAYLVAAEGAERLGWLSRAISGYDGAGRTAFRGADYAKARKALQRLLVLNKQVRNRAGAAAVLGNLGLLASVTGDFPQAIQMYEDVLAEKQALGDKGSIAITLGNLGGVYASVGEYAKALSVHERRRDLMRAVGNERGVARALHSIGLVYAALGDYPRALSAVERALKAMEALDDAWAVGNALADLGMVYGSLGDYEKALVTYERAHSIQESMGNKAAAATTIGNIAIAHYQLHNYEESLAMSLRALDAKEALGDRLGAAMTLGNIGNVYQAQGDFAKALDFRERALAAKEALGDKVGAATTLSNIGRLYLDQGELEKARDALRHSVRAARSLRAVPVLVPALRDLAQVYLELGNSGRALMTAQQALTEAEALLGGLGEEQGALARQALGTLFAIGTVAAMQEEDPAEALVFLESGRAGAFLDMLDKRDALRWKAEALSPELKQAELEAAAAHRAARFTYDQAAKTGNRRKRTEAGRVLDEATDRVRDVAGRIQRELKNLANLFYPRPKTIDAIKGSLGSDQALVLYGLCLDQAVALVLRRGSERIVSLGKAADVIAAVEGLDATSAARAPEPALATLRSLLVQPLELKADVRQVIVSPVSSLGYLPFGALFDQAVAVTPSGTTHVLLRGEERKQGEGVLALGEPDYGPAAQDGQGVLHRGRPLAPLPATRLEVESIGTTTLLGAAASEAGFRKALTGSKRWRAVHFACHGLVDSERPMASSLALSRGGDDDGFFTANEILRTEIPADLAVLSACETARGKILQSEGIVGLTRSFMFAGTPRVIASLWKVDDKATQALMIKFYELWNPKEGKGVAAAQALQQAQAFVQGQEQWKHPYYWAAWVLWGLPN